MVRSSVASRSKRDCRPFFCGKNPSKQKRSLGKPELTNAGTNAVAPGKHSTSTPCCVAKRTSKNPGSDIDGDIDGDDVVISKVGDINADGSVDVKDLVRLMKYISGADVTICGSDVNGDGVTDTRDLVRLMRIIAAA